MGVTNHLRTGMILQVGKVCKNINFQGHPPFPYYTPPLFLGNLCNTYVDNVIFQSKASQNYMAQQ